MLKSFFLSALILIPATALRADTRSGKTVSLLWGIEPKATSQYGCNGSRLYKVENGVEKPFAEKEFTARYRLCLAWVGDGSYDATRGYKTMRWIEETEYEVGSTATETPYIEAWGRSSVPLDAFAPPFVLPEEYEGEEWTDEDMEAIKEAEGYYDSVTNAWETTYQFACLAYDTQTRRYHRLTADSAGTAFADPMYAYIPADTGPPGAPGSVASSGFMNRAYLFASTETKKLFIGEALPDFCIWRASQGYDSTEACLTAGYTEEQIAGAYALQTDLSTHGGISLSLTEPAVSATTGRVEVTGSVMQHTVSGTEAPVTALYNGASLFLESSTSLSNQAWSAETLSPDASGNVRKELPASSQSGFFRLKLQLPEIQ